MTLVLRLVRSQMLEVLRTDYIKFARARGLTNRAVHFRHALKNTLLPVITVIGMQVGGLIAFSIITETVFQWPGMGQLFIQSVQFADIPVMAAYLVMVSFLFVTINFFVDLLYAAIDPRLRLDRAPAGHGGRMTSRKACHSPSLGADRRGLPRLVRRHLERHHARALPARHGARPRCQHAAGRQPGVADVHVLGRHLGAGRLAVRCRRPTASAGRGASLPWPSPCWRRRWPAPSSGLPCGPRRRRLLRRLHGRGLRRGLRPRARQPARPCAGLGDERPVAHPGDRRADGRRRGLADRLARLAGLRRRPCLCSPASACSPPSGAARRATCAAACGRRCARRCRPACWACSAPASPSASATAWRRSTSPPSCRRPIICP